ncbi:MAG: HNH endonuclease [Candidatus Methylumidiphilus sp.]
MSRTHIPVSLRRLAYERAGGCCEYCGMSERFSFALHQIDHIIAEKHGGATMAENLALSCILCNKHKGSDLASIDPLTGKISPLFHPRSHVWLEHFAFEADGRLVSATAEGRATIRLLQMNQPERVEERRLLREYGFWLALMPG